jgi:hypothetical protein
MLFRAAGLIIAAHRIIPGLVSAPQAGDADIEIFTGIAPPWADSFFHPWHTSDERDARGIANVEVMRTSAGFRFSYADRTRFWVDAGGHHVWMIWQTTFEDACTYLVGPVLAFVLRRRGALALHASAVRVGDQALALVGPHGAGKSTIAAALGRRGCGVIADDVLRVTRGVNRWLAHPFGGMLRLWPDAEALVFGRMGRLSRITPSWDKRALPLGEHGVTAVEVALPLAAIAFLDAPDPSSGSHRIAPLRPAAALVRLAANGSAAHLLDISQRAAEFADLADLAQSARCAAVAAAPRGSESDGFYDRLLEWACAGAAEAVT